MAATAKAKMKGHVPGIKIGPAPATVEVKVDGSPIPTSVVRKLTGITEEKEKYLKCWAVDDYRKYSPGEVNLPMFLEAYPAVAEEDKALDIVDWGCGTGRASLLLLDAGFDVTLVDFASNCLDEEVSDQVVSEEASCEFNDRVNPFKFVEHDLSKKIKLRAQFGYCCDVMEHIPPDQVDDVLEVILENSRNVFFQICTTEDHFGKHPAINHPLHLSVHGYQWWLNKLVGHGCIIHRSIEKPGHVIFFVTGYTGFSYDKLSHNSELDEIHDHMRENAALGYPNIMYYEEEMDANDEVIERECVVICGGPSISTVETISALDAFKERKNAGERIHFITMNGSYRWAGERGYWPCTQFMLDARQFNARFVHPLDGEDQAQNTFIMASQCSPDTLADLPKKKTYLWQVNISQHSIPLIEELWGEMYKDWCPCPGGSTVLMRVLPQLQQMGYRKIHIFGADSCLMDEEHHAYSQPENDVHPGSVIELTPRIPGVESRTFRVHPWMLGQVKEFMDMRETLLRHLDMTVYGDGLIAYLIEHNANIPQE